MPPKYSSRGALESPSSKTGAALSPAGGVASARRFAFNSQSVSGRTATAAGFIKEPGAPLGFVDPVLDQARARHVAMLVAHIVGHAHPRHEVLVVLAQFGEHVEGIDIGRVIVLDPLQLGDMADGANGGPADLADTLGDVVRGAIDLVGMLVQQQVIVAE